jgi:hypothetical protein
MFRVLAAFFTPFSCASAIIETADVKEQRICIKFWVALGIKATQTSFLRKLMGLFRMDSVRSEEIREQLATESKLNKVKGRYQNYWRAHVTLLEDCTLL